jgi:hypothetical protein
MVHVTQFILLARRGDSEDWVNILVIGVMAVLWLVAALIKSLSKKAAQQEQAEGSTGQPRRPGETWQQRLARKAEEIQRRLEEQAGVRQPGGQRPPAREAATRSPQGPGARISVRPGRQGESGVAYERPPSQPSTQREHHVAHQREARRVVAAGQQATTPMIEPVHRDTLEPMLADLGSIMAESPQPLQPGEIQQGPPRDAGGFEPDAIIDYSDPDALKKAILHYEILGKPIALRDMPESASTF